MKLTDKEKRMLEGEEGNAVRRAMELLIAIGDAYGAEEMVEVSYTHLVAPDLLLWTTGKVGELTRDIVAEAMGDVKRLKARASIGPVIFDPALLERFGYPKAYVDEMRHSISKSKDLYERRGVFPDYTCCPFFLFPSHKGEHLALAESMVQVFHSTVYGATTNRESGPSALASAITGRTPFCGLHLPEKRLAKMVIHLKEDLDPRQFSHTDYSLLGYYVSRQVKDKIPVYTGLPPSISITDIMYLISSHTTVPLCHIEGVTPEAPTLEVALGGKKAEGVVEVGRKELQGLHESLCSAKDTSVNWVLLGCPHFTLEQLQETAALLADKRVHKNVKLVIATLEPYLALAKKMGIIKVIEDAGGHVVAGICAVQFPQRDVPQGYRMGNIATDRAGVAGMFRAMNVPAWFGDIKQCMQAAVSGKWEAQQ